MKNLINLIKIQLLSLTGFKLLKKVSMVESEGFAQPTILQVPFAHSLFLSQYESTITKPNRLLELEYVSRQVGVLLDKLVLEFFYHFIKAESQQETLTPLYSSKQVLYVREALNSLDLVSTDTMIELILETGLFRKFINPALLIRDMLTTELCLLEGRIYLREDYTYLIEEEVLEAWLLINCFYINNTFQEIITNNPQVLLLLNNLFLTNNVES